nr:mitogen-activated protein kinase kinase kinase NPK1-like [Ipomoea trifida]
MTAWEKQRFLGSGSYGQVHLAVLKPAGEMKMAVKSAAIQCSCSLQREGAFLDALRDCPFIVRCFGEDVSMEHGKHVYNLLLEYAPGGTLHQLIKNTGGIPEDLARLYTYQLLKGIHYMHTLGIIHCDLKPQNVLVFPGKFHGLKRLKLCDFGLAKFSDETNVYDDSHRGTIQYAAPECLAGRSYTGAKDIWAVGCMFVEMVTGKPMWEVNNEDELGMKIPKHFSPSAKSFLKMCLDREPGRRWTAEKLPSHPFLERLDVVFESKKEEEGFVNPLGALRWSSSRDLFRVLPEKEKEKEVFDLNVAFKEEREEEVFDLNVVFEEEVFDLNVFFKEEWKREEVERCFPGCLVHWS